ncbi:M48 family metallopeptidase [Geomonas sp. Red32]|uniref:M48 family metallopeptidase n=1 Tax=Geomonas sp. Red32 TaxID=2912856 RepID=UPI00202CEB2B|nr:M48 family metallopeptidase [Geomonas sp. Red32]MCM0080000.1 M48 family metallopeptidase [Geomonas sp. Red32]
MTSKQKKSRKGKKAPTRTKQVMRWHLDGTFPGNDPNGQPVGEDFRVVAHDVICIVKDLITGTPLSDPREIKIGITSRPVPYIDATTDPKFLLIFLSMTDDDLMVRRDYAKFAFQLGHELGHAVMGPLRTNGLIETLADAFSYEVLDRMNRLWERKYSATRPHWASWASHFTDYQKNEEAERFAGLPASIRNAVGEPDWPQVPDYLKNNLGILEMNLTEEAGLRLRSLGASALRRNKIPWKDLLGISGFTTPSAKDDPGFRSDLQTEVHLLPNAVRNILPRIGR